MTILEIQDEKTKLFDAKTDITEKAKAEGRALTDTEMGTLHANLRRLKELDLEMETEKLRADVGSEVRGFGNVHYAAPREKFSLMKTIRSRVEGQGFSDVAKDVFTIGRQEFRKSGVNSAGDIVIPSYYERADILAGTAAQGQEIVSEDKKSILPPLVDKLVFSQAGATFMPGLVGNVSIPSYAGTAVAWATEVGGAADGAGAHSEVNFSPLRLTAYIDVSKLFLAQDGVGAERLLLDNIASAVARQLEKTILGPATLVANTQPSGIGYKLNVANGGGVAELSVAGGTVTWGTMVGLESSIDASNALQGNLAYITNAVGRGLLKTVDKGTANDTGDYLMSEDNMINGYPCLVTNSIVSTYGAGGAGNMVVFGNWADLMIGQWGGYDITVDPYSLASTNQVRIVINSYFDAKGLRGSTGANATLDQYAISFAALSITA